MGRKKLLQHASILFNYAFDKVFREETSLAIHFPFPPSLVINFSTGNENSLALFQGEFIVILSSVGKQDQASFWFGGLL